MAFSSSNGGDNRYYSSSVEEVNGGVAFKGLVTSNQNVTYYLSLDKTQNTFSSEYDFVANLSATLSKEYTLDSSNMGGEDAKYSGNLKTYKDEKGNTYARLKWSIPNYQSEIKVDLSLKYQDTGDGKIDSGLGIFVLDDEKSSFQLITD